MAGAGGSASLPLGVGSTAVASGGAAGLKDVLPGFSAAGTIFNLEASEFIKSHGDVTAKKVAHAVRKGIAQPGV